MKISEYQTNRHAEAVRRREERERTAYEAYKAAAELADAHTELEQLLADHTEVLDIMTGEKA